MRNVYILSGGMESTRSREYREIGRLFGRKGFRVNYVEIEWRRKNPTDWVNQFINSYRPSDYDILFGFSWGAWSAFVASTRIKTDKLILCSLSPFFSEDIPHLKRWWVKGAGKARIRDFKRYHFNSLASKCNAEAILMYGEKEVGAVVERAKKAHKLLRGSMLVVVPDGKHDLKGENYAKAVAKVVGML